MTEPKIPSIPPLSIDSAKSKSVKSTVVKTEVREETPLQYTQRILAGHNGMESDIPVNHDYWRVKRGI